MGNVINTFVTFNTFITFRQSYFFRIFIYFSGMANREPVLECVPNFSEGRDPAKIAAIADEIRSVHGAQLLHVDTSPAANRTVMTIAGAPGAVVEAAYRAIRKAASVIDMRLQDGVHPRIGATDVCPLVPLYNMEMEEAVAYARLLAGRVGQELQIPVYLYEYAATTPYRRALPDIRRGQYEGLAGKMMQPDWKPDYGPAVFAPSYGATVIGARDILVAFNISIDTKDVGKAVYIAERIRERGFVRRDGGARMRVPGLLPRVRAIGWYMDDFECAQVSMNLLDYRASSPLQVWEACRQLAEEVGVSLVGSELIGLMPETCLLEAGSYSYKQQKEPAPSDKALLSAAGIRYLGLDQVKPFDPEEKILEHALRRERVI